MSKIVLNDVTNLNALSVINDNFDKLEQELQTKVLYRDNPEGEPNTLENDVDANGNSLYNVQDLTINGGFTVDGQDVGAYIGQAADAAADALASATAAANSATAASASASSANADAISATANASTATTKASEASTSASNAANSATAAASSTSTASTQAGIATTKASEASASASAAATSASSASTSASTATTQSGIATTKASEAASSATSAAASAAAAATFDPSFYLAKADNLNSVASKSTSRTNLGLAIGTDVQAYNVNLQGASQSGITGFKNRIINGAMMIDQRNAGASVTPTNLSYNLDRWGCLVSQASKFTVQRNAGSVTPPVGFSNYLGVTSSSAYSVLSGDRFVVYQAIEGLNAADLAWGTVNAQTVTLSFQVRSSLTGTFSGCFRTGSGTDYSYPFTYSIPTANTWTTITITVPGPTVGTWLSDNSLFGYVAFSLGVGSTYSGAAGAWTAGNLWGNSSAVSVVGTSGATWYITGVQLEKGSTATSFDYRPYGTELALCQRYCFVQSGGGNKRHFVSGNASGTTAFPTTKFPVTMRTGPSLTISSAGHFTFETYTSSQQTCTGISSNVSTPDEMSVTVSVASSLATGGNVIGSNASAQVIFSAEL